MDDFGIALEDLARDSALEEVAGFPKADMEIEMSNFKENQGAFMQNELGMNPDDLDVQDGKITYQDKELDMSKVSDDLANGNIVGAFEDMGIVDKNVMDKVSGFQDKYNEAVKNSQRYKDSQNLKQAQANGDKMKDALGGNPTSEADFEAKTKKMQKTIDDLQKKLEDDKASGKDDSYCSGWMGKAKCIGLVGAVFSLAWLFKTVADHSCEMSGCWLVKNSDGTKCKVSAMSCNDEASSGNVCTSTSIIQGADFANACIKYVPSCTATGSPAPFGQPDPCCATDGKLPSSCSGGKCGLTSAIEGASDNASQYCSCSAVKCPSGYTLTPKDVDFWGAWNDLGLPNPFSGLSSLFGTLEKILLYVVVGLVIVLALYYGIKYAFSFGSGSKKEG